MRDSRKLAPVEQGMEILNRRTGSSNVVTISRVRGPLTEDLVRQALDLVQCRHPRLSSRIVGALDNLHFEAIGKLEVPLRVVNQIYNEQWQSVVRQELNQKIESSEGLLRAVFLRSQTE
ncbi:MAG TPA: hypothetical protein V6D03_13370, partial [Candidatus Caenarcaniphilales bacterium]